MIALLSSYWSDRIHTQRLIASQVTRQLFIGDRHDAAFLGLARQSDGLPVDITLNPSYTLVSLGGQYRLSNELTLFLRADNLTDARYESVLGYPGLPRAFVIGGRFNLGE